MNVLEQFYAREFSRTPFFSRTTHPDGDLGMLLSSYGVKRILFCDDANNNTDRNGVILFFEGKKYPIPQKEAFKLYRKIAS